MRFLALALALGACATYEPPPPPEPIDVARIPAWEPVAEQYQERIQFCRAFQSARRNSLRRVFIQSKECDRCHRNR